MHQNREEAMGAGMELMGSQHVWAGDLTQEDQQLFAALLSDRSQGGRTLEIDENMSDRDLVKSITAVTKVYGRVEKLKRQITPILGKLMVMMERRPAVMSAFGATSIAHFCNEIAPRQFHVCRTDAYQAHQIAKAFPDLSPADYVRLGHQNIKAIGKAHEWDPKVIAKPEVQKYLKMAETMDRHEIVNAMEDDGVNVDRIQVGKVNFPANRETVKRWNKFVANKRIQAYCEVNGNGCHETIFNRMMDECEVDWTAAGKLAKSLGEDPIEAEFEMIETERPLGVYNQWMQELSRNSDRGEI